MTDRPWALEVWSDEKIEWETWSTYVNESNARDRQVRLTSKGYDAQIAYTGPNDETPCDLCGESHAAPHDGRCLL